MFTEGQKVEKHMNWQTIIRQHKWQKKGISHIVCTYVIACMEGKKDHNYNSEEICFDCFGGST